MKVRDIKAEFQSRFDESFKGEKEELATRVTGRLQEFRESLSALEKQSNVQLTGAGDEAIKELKP